MSEEQSTNLILSKLSNQQLILTNTQSSQSLKLVEQKSTLDNHENRITSLENYVPPVPTALLSVQAAAQVVLTDVGVPAFVTFNKHVQVTGHPFNVVDGDSYLLLASGFSGRIRVDYTVSFESSGTDVDVTATLVSNKGNVVMPTVEVQSKKFLYSGSVFSPSLVASDNIRLSLQKDQGLDVVTAVSCQLILTLIHETSLVVTKEKEYTKTKNEKTVSVEVEKVECNSVKDKRFDFLENLSISNVSKEKFIEYMEGKKRE